VSSMLRLQLGVALLAAAIGTEVTDYIAPEVQYVSDFRHSVEVGSDGGVYVSGRNDFGQLGDGTNIHRSQPQKVKSAVTYVPGLPVRLIDLGPRPEYYDVLEGQTGDLLEYDYDTARCLVRMHDGSRNVRLVLGHPEELEPKHPLDADVPDISASPPLGSRRRSGCRVTNSEKTVAWIVHDDGSKNLITYPNARKCLTDALVMPESSLRMYLPRYGIGKEGYALSEEVSELACIRAPACKACNTFDDSETCPNNATFCDPPLGQWEHGTCRLKFTPGLVITARQLALTPQVELNRRVGHLVQYDLRFGMEWEARLSPVQCPMEVCDSGNVVSVALPLHLLELNGEAFDAAAGAFHSVFLWTDGSVWSTGRNDQGQLGTGDLTDRNFPRFSCRGVQAVAAGFYHSVYLLSNGTVLAAGRNQEGQLGDGTLVRRLSPVKVIDGVKKIVAGAFHTIFLKHDNSTWATGHNIYGQLGDGSTISRSSPVHVLDGVTSIEAGEYYTVFLTEDPISQVTTLWRAGLSDTLGPSGASWTPLQPFNEAEVQKMSLSK